MTTNWGDGLQVTAIALQQIATALFTTYALPFELVSLLLLAAIIGAIFLARRPEEDERAN
jgi:NADH:ubiquinone oxidoreductase subunit 6 (subunit J)